MLRYTVTATMVPEHAPEYEAWLRQGHCQAVMEMGGALTAEVARVDRADEAMVSLQATYLFPSRAAFDAYSAGPAAVLRAEGLKLFAETGKVAEWGRSVGIVQESWSSSTPAPAPASPKTGWPELVGVDVNEALQTISSSRRDVDVIITPEGSIVTMELCETRVRIWTKDGVVSRKPRIG
jgi:hypothetical protein